MSSRAVLVARIWSTPAASRVENSEVLTVLPAEDDAAEVGSVALGLLIWQPVRARLPARPNGQDTADDGGLPPKAWADGRQRGRHWCTSASKPETKRSMMPGILLVGRYWSTRSLKSEPMICRAPAGSLASRFW